MSIVRVAYPNPLPSAQSDFVKQDNLIETGFLMINKPIWISGGNILQGNVFQCGGTVYYTDADTAIVGAASDYVKLVPNGDGSELDPEYVANLGGVSWNKVYNGYYDVGGNLYIFDELLAIQAGEIASANTRLWQAIKLAFDNYSNLFNPSIIDENLTDVSLAGGTTTKRIIYCNDFTVTANTILKCRCLYVEGDLTINPGVTLTIGTLKNVSNQHIEVDYIAGLGDEIGIGGAGGAGNSPGANAHGGDGGSGFCDKGETGGVNAGGVAGIGAACSSEFIIIIVKGDFINNGSIVSNGSNGGNGVGAFPDGGGGGGGSAGGCIVIAAYGDNPTIGTITCNGGNGGTGSALTGGGGGGGGGGHIEIYAKTVAWGVLTCNGGNGGAGGLGAGANGSNGTQFTIDISNKPLHVVGGSDNGAADENVLAGLLLKYIERIL
jgi:hypothetical protein